jgi:hypothetical protein
MQATSQQENSSDAATGMKGRIRRSAKECCLLISGGCCTSAAVRPLSVAAVKDKYRLI